MSSPADPVFFTDRDLGHIVPDALEQAGYTVERHDEHFGPLTPDTVWLREIGRRGWVALSHNTRIRYETEERDMVMRAGVPLFFLVGHRTTHAELALNLVQTVPKVLRFLQDHRPPFLAKVYRPSPTSAVYEGKPGRVEMWVSEKDWQGDQGKGGTS